MSDPTWDEVLDPAEFARREEIGRMRLDGEDGEEMLALLQWFQRRYPTPLARLRYIRAQTASVLRAKA